MILKPVLDGPFFDGIVMDLPGRPTDRTPILVWICVDERGWAITNLEINMGFVLQWAAQQGFRLFIPSHRITGLNGLRYVRDHWLSGAMVADVAAGVQSLRERVSPQSPIVVFGHSIGGGIAYEMLITYPDLLSAAVVSGAGAEFSLIYSMNGFANTFMKRSFGSPPWERPCKYFAVSPMRGVANVSCPVLLLMGSEDVDLPGARHFYVALREAERDVTFLVLKGEDHWPEGVQKQTVYLETAFTWLRKKVATEG